MMPYCHSAQDWAIAIALAEALERKRTRELMEQRQILEETRVQCADILKGLANR